MIARFYNQVVIYKCQLIINQGGMRILNKIYKVVCLLDRIEDRTIKFIDYSLLFLSISVNTINA